MEAVATINSRGIIQSCNDNFLPLFGYHKADLIGHNVNMLMPHPYREHHDEYMHRYITTREPRILGKGKRFVHARHVDGSEFPVWLDVNECETDAAGEPLFSGIITRVRDEEATLAGGTDVIETRLSYVGTC